MYNSVTNDLFPLKNIRTEVLVSRAEQSANRLK